MGATTENPFGARRIRPGALPYLFAADVDAASLAGRLRGNGWWGEIVGAHGTGKSALLAAMVPVLEQHGQRVLLVELHDNQRRLPLDPKREHRIRPFTLLLIDGYEQLSRWSRFRLTRLCRRRNWGLLVTAHDSVGLPHLYRSVITPESAERVVAQMMIGLPPLLTNREVSDCLARHHGDLREMLFELYDLYEQRPSSSQNLT
jgi:hypothetical protein